jgi:hypothetical protein
MGFEKLKRAHEQDMAARNAASDSVDGEKAAFSVAILAAKTIINGAFDEALPILQQMGLRPSKPDTLRIVTRSGADGKIGNRTGAHAAIRFYPANSPKGIPATNPAALYIVVDSDQKHLSVVGTSTVVSTPDEFVAHDKFTTNAIAAESFERVLSDAIDRALVDMRVLRD